MEAAHAIRLRTLWRCIAYYYLRVACPLLDHPRPTLHLASLRNSDEVIFKFFALSIELVPANDGLLLGWRLRFHSSIIRLLMLHLIAGGIGVEKAEHDDLGDVAPVELHS